MDSITIDGMEEMEFRRSIEAMLRHGQADDAADKLRTLLANYAGEGRILPGRFLSVTAQDLRLEGWDQLGEKLGEYDRPEVPMSAISIDILDPQGVGARPDAGGLLRPVIETSYFSDSAYPFSEAGREDLLDGYSTFGCEWQGNFETVDTVISIEGIDDLYGATVSLENKVASSAKVDLADIQAGSVGSCYLAVLIHQAIRDAAREMGLPRPICILAGSNDAYPFFDAPAMTAEEYRMTKGLEAFHDDAAASQDTDESEDDAPAAAGGMASLESLIGLGARKKEKKPVLTIAPDEADTAESLDMPVAVEAESMDRVHIMPSLDLVEDPSDADAWYPGDPVAAAPVEEHELFPEPAAPSPPLDFAVELPDPPSDLHSPQPVAPTDFGDASSVGLIEFEARTVPQEPLPPLELGGFEPCEPADSEPKEPLARLPSDAAGPADTDAAALDHESPDEVSGYCPAGPLDFSEDEDGDAPLDLQGFAAADAPFPEEWTAAHDLPASDETGDRLPWPSGAGSHVAVRRVEEPRPARHAIRVIAASVTSQESQRKQRSSPAGPSLVLRLILAVGAACTWLWKRIARG